ncbi:MAG: ribosome biogenesis GTPase Der [Pseudomonadales bacterium]|nr:ribosome biogenesis GTPase Der [Pseudomonadales bacterium]
MLPVVALVGQPNVGKSTLFNRMTGTRDALVADIPGLTRDRQYGEVIDDDYHFILIDTGGISGAEEGIDSMMAGQTRLAIEEADLVVFVVDCRVGLGVADEMVAQFLRQNSKKTLLVGNKVDGQDPDQAISEFYSLGLGAAVPTCAAQNYGIADLIDQIAEQLPMVEPEVEEDDGSIRIGVVGRPNVGKSTLVNRLLGEERVVVYDQPGTTRDSIHIKYEHEGKPYTLIDTAGVRRRGSVKGIIEKFSVVKTLQSIRDANLVLMLMDAQEGVVEQDLHLLDFVLEAGRSLIIVINKWDGLDEYQKSEVRRQIDRRLHFVDFAEIIFISALHGSGVGKLYPIIDRTYESAMGELKTNMLNGLLEQAVHEHAPPMVNGRRIKLRYAHPGGENPPRIIIHGNQTDKMPSDYTRYLQNFFRKKLELKGTPIRIEFRSSENPFAGRRNKLTTRQVSKKRRLMKHVKKKKR